MSPGLVPGRGQIGWGPARGWGLESTLMIWWPFRKRELESAAERMRREHSRFLTRAMLGGRRYPRIPSKRVASGGFDALRSREGGAERAGQWWSAALDRVDQDD